jgi:hypothetical protein
MHQSKNTEFYSQREKDKAKRDLKKFSMHDYFRKLNEEFSTSFQIVLDTNICFNSNSSGLVGLLMRESFQDSINTLISQNDSYIERMTKILNKNPNIITNEIIIKELNSNLTNWRSLLSKKERFASSPEIRDLISNFIQDHLGKLKNISDLLYERERKISIIVKNLNHYYNFTNLLKDLIKQCDVEENDKETFLFAATASLNYPTKLLSLDKDMVILYDNLNNSLDLINETLPKKQFYISNNQVYHSYNYVRNCDIKIHRIIFRID